MRRFQMVSRFAVPAVVLAAAAVFAVSPAEAQVYGQLSPAPVLASGERSIGAYGRFDSDFWGAIGHARLGFGGGFDAGATFGFSSYENTPLADGPNTLVMALDARRQIRWAAEGEPVDASLGFGVGFESGDDFTIWTFQPQVLSSHRIVYDDAGRAVAPYASVGMSIHRAEVAGFSDTEVDLLARIGGSWEPNRRIGVTAELAFGGQTTFLAGVRWPF